MNALATVKFQDRHRFIFVNFEPFTDDVQVGVVEAVFLDGAALNAVDEAFFVIAFEVENGDDIKNAAQHFRLMNIARNAIQHQRVMLGMKPADLGGVDDVLPPKLDRRRIRHELAATGIFDKNFSERTIRAQIAEHIAARAMEKIWDDAENFALRAFARTGRAKKKNAAVFQAVLGMSLISKISFSATVT